MSIIYVNENGAVIGVENNRCTIRYKDSTIQSIPIEMLEGITIMGQSQITTQCVQECLLKGIPVAYFSKGGKYFGHLQSTGHFNASRQRKQCELYESEYSIDFSKRIIIAKLNNQRVLLRRYEKSKQLAETEFSKNIKICRNKIESCRTIPEIMGYEGQAAKSYFAGLSEVVKKDFRFQGRNRRPPLDPFNSMLSLGYSVIMNEIYGKLEQKGLNPYFGFMHKDYENHPTLASDLMEEWRPIIVDATVMSLVNGNEISLEDFYFDTDEPGCYITRNGLKIFLNKLEKKLLTQVKYLSYVDYEISFRRAMDLQINQLVKSIEEQDVTLYIPITIR